MLFLRLKYAERIEPKEELNRLYKIDRGNRVVPYIWLNSSFGLTPPCKRCINLTNSLWFSSIMSSISIVFSYSAFPASPSSPTTITIDGWVLWSGDLFFPNTSRGHIRRGKCSRRRV